MLKQKIIQFREKKLVGDVFFNFRYYQDKYYIVSFTYCENEEVKSDYFYATDFNKHGECLNLFVYKVLTSNPDCNFICFDIKHAFKPIIYKSNLIKLLNVKVYDIQLLIWMFRATKNDGININNIYNYTQSDLFTNSKMEHFYKIYQRKDFEFFIPIDIFREYFNKESTFLFNLYESKLKVKHSDTLERQSYTNYKKFLIVLSLIEKSPICYSKDKIDNLNDAGSKKYFEKLTKHRYLHKVSCYYNNITLCHSDYGRLGASKSLCNLFMLNKKYREIFTPNYDTFMSIDLKANHAFYLFKSLGLLDNVEIDSSFDIYSYIDDSPNLSRREKKENINPILFGGKKNSEYTKEFFRKFPEVREFFDNKAKQCRKDGYIISELTGKYNTINVNEPNWVGTLISFILQNETAYEMFNFVTAIYSEMAKKNMYSNVWFVLHDEIILDVKKEEIEDIKSIISKTINVPYQCSVNKTWNFKE